MSNQVSEIISKFGGIRPMARMLSYPPSTVSNWENRNSIPARHQRHILDVAKENKISIKPIDLIIYSGEGGNV